MKRIFTLMAAFAMVAAAATAQDEAKTGLGAGTWSTISTPALKVSEQLFNNWSKSGNSTFDVTSTFFGNYKYTHPKFVWDNVTDLAYGYAWQDLDPEGVLFETRRKSNDKIDLTSALSWNAYKGWGASLTANLKTQFGKGYEFENIHHIRNSYRSKGQENEHQTLFGHFVGLSQKGIQNSQTP